MATPIFSYYRPSSGSGGGGGSTVVTTPPGADIINGVSPVTQKLIVDKNYGYNTDMSNGLYSSNVSKGSPGILLGFSATSINAAMRYLWIWNSVYVADPATMVFPISAGSATVATALTMGSGLFGLNGKYFSDSIMWGFSTSLTSFIPATATDHTMNLNFL